MNDLETTFFHSSPVFGSFNQAVVAHFCPRFDIIHSFFCWYPTLSSSICTTWQYGTVCARLFLHLITCSNHWNCLRFATERAERRWPCSTGGNWQKWKRVFLTCPCYEIYRDDAVVLKSFKYTWKITIFVEMWNLGQYRENLIFCQ